MTDERVQERASARTMIRTVSILLVVTACRAQVVELGTPDAAGDAAGQDAPTSTCVCRLTPCRVTGDCVLTGGTCGPDFYCTGDFGSCTSTAGCQATATDSVCTQSATSTLPCP